MNHELKEDAVVRAKNDMKRKSMQFGEIKYGSDKFASGNQEYVVKEQPSKKLSGASSKIKYE